MSVTWKKQANKQRKKKGHTEEPKALWMLCTVEVNIETVCGID